MSRYQKAVARLLSRPKDLTWHEVRTILTKLGYDEQKATGSRRKFIHAETQHIISLHEPHPKPTMKAYAVNYIIDELQKTGRL